MKIEFLASVVGGAAIGTAVLASFVKVLHVIQTKLAIKTALKSMFGHLGGPR
jgi:hypothetical protein